MGHTHAHTHVYTQSLYTQTPTHIPLSCTNAHTHCAGTVTLSMLVQDDERGDAPSDLARIKILVVTLAT